MSERPYSYHAIQPVGEGSGFEFELLISRPAVRVRVPRSVVEAYATAHSTAADENTIESLAGSIQPDLARAAFRKLQLRETIELGLEDIDVTSI